MPEIARCIRFADFLPVIWRESRQAKRDRRRLIDHRTQKLVDHLGEFKSADKDVKRKAAQIRRGKVSEQIDKQETAAGGMAPDAWEYAVARITTRAVLTQKQLENWASRIVLNAPLSNTHVTDVLAPLEKDGLSAVLFSEIELKYPEVSNACRVASTPIEAAQSQSSLSAPPTRESAIATENVVLSKADECILRVLAKSKRGLTQLEIAARTDKVIRSRRAIGYHLTRLRKMGLIHRPNGTHGGDAISAKGRAAIE